MAPSHRFSFLSFLVGFAVGFPFNPVKVIFFSRGFEDNSEPQSLVAFLGAALRSRPRSMATSRSVSAFDRDVRLQTGPQSMLGLRDGPNDKILAILVGPF